MRLTIHLSCITVASLILLVQSTAAIAGDQAKQPLTFPEYKKAVQSVDVRKHTMTLETFKSSITKKGTYVVDLRDKAAYKQGHIKGALHLGADITAEKLAALIPDKQSTVVLYCTNTLFPTRMIALTFSSLPQIITLGYPNTFVLESLRRKDMNSAETFMKGPLWEKGQEQPNPH